MKHYRISLAFRISCAALASGAIAVAGGCRRPEPQLPAAPGMSVLLISLDTTRADRLGCYGYAAAQTPNIDQLAAEGTLFEQCTTSVPGTLPAHTSLLTGLYPFAHGVRLNGSYRLDESYQTLAEAMRSAGYRTFARVAAMVLNREFGLDQGFEVYQDVRAPVSTRRRTGPAELPAGTISDAAIGWLRAHRSDRFFLFVHYFDPHHPYEPPEPFRASIPDPYDGEIAYTDSQVGRLLAALRELEREADTLVVLTADHGEGLGEHREPTHGFYLYDSTLHVPLILRKPGLIPAGQRVAAQVRLVDVAPTILALTGLPPLPGVHGVDLRPLLLDPARDVGLAAYAENLYPFLRLGYSQLRAWRAGGWKFIQAPRPELYDLAADPHELSDRAPLEPERVASMREELRALLAAAAPAPDGQQSVAASDIRRLEALGYLHTPPAGEPGDPDVFEPVGENPMDHAEALELNARAIMALSTGSPPQAEAALRAALERGPQSPGVVAWTHARLGSLLASLGRYAESLPHLRRSLELDPGDALVRSDYGVALLYAGELEQAESELAKAREQRTASADAYEFHAIALSALGRLEESLAAFERAVALEPALATVYAEEAATFGISQPANSQAGQGESRRGLELAALAASLGFPSAAIPHYEAWISRQPEDAVTWALLGEAYALTGALEHAERSLRRALELNAGLVRAWDYLGVTLRGRGDAAGAVEAFRRGLALAPQNASIANELAWLLATSPHESLRNGPEAVRLAELALRGGGENSAAVLDTYAAALAETGQFERALAVLDRALRLASQPGQEEFADQLRARRALYERGEPYREQTGAASAPAVP